MKNIDSRKVQLIQQIATLDSESDLISLQKHIELLKLTNKHKGVFRSIRKTISVEELKQEQNYQGIDRAKFDRLVDDLDIQEPLEDLLEMLD